MSQNNRKNYKIFFKTDFLYDSYWMGKFIHKFMKAGKKQIVEKTVFLAFRKIKMKTGSNIFFLFLNLLIRFRPLFGFSSARLGQQIKKVPVPLYPRRQTIISLNWLTTSISLNRFYSFETRLIYEFLYLHARKKTVLWKRYSQYLSDVYANRLNQRFRWK